MILNKKTTACTKPKGIIMKKIKLVSVLLVVLLALTLALTACKNAKTLSQEVRWNQNEVHVVYNISLQGDVAAESNQVTFDNKAFVKHFATTPDDYDRVKPIAVEGTYTVDLSINEDNNTVDYVTEQRVVETYDLSNVYAEAFYNYVTTTTDEDCSFLKAQRTSEGFVFVSSTHSAVYFENDSTMKPKSSTQLIGGYYIGKSNYEVNYLQYTTEYADGKATVTTGWDENAKVETYEVADNVLDALQIPLIVRSLDQSKSTTDGKYMAPSVAVYDFKTNKTVALTFNVSSQTYVVLDKMSATHPYAVASVVTVGTQGYTGFLYTFTSVNGQRDTFSSDVGPVNKYTQVRFQSEYYVYELASYTADQVEDLKYVPAPTTETPEN